MKRIFPLLLCMCLLLVGCSNPAAPREQQYTATFLTLFDTVTTVVGVDESEEEFREKAQQIHDELLVYHQLFDIYHDYEGIHNLKTVNDAAGQAPVVVDESIIALLQDCKAYYDLTGGKVNAAMGSVLRLWHDARTDGIADPLHARIPEREALIEASQHMDFAHVIIDETASTVYLADPELSLDVGAIAKGWATQRVAENAPEGLLISVGGNVCATGGKSADTPWVVGIRDPKDAEKNLHTLYVERASVVTSGDYQRTYMVDGEEYHHIIDPLTLLPAKGYTGVTIVCGDSGLADALSTALFLLPIEEGRALAEACGAAVLWVEKNGEETMTPAFRAMLRT